MFLSALVLPLFLAPQDLPPGSPHPTHVVDSHHLMEYLDGGHWPSEWPVWQSLQPRWFDEEPMTLLADEDQEALAAFVGSRNHWSDKELQKWVEFSKQAPVPISFSLRDRQNGEVLLAGSHQVHLGRPIAIRDLVQRQVVRDLDVEIAQASAIADPVIGAQFAGRSLALELLPVPGHGFRAELSVVDSAFGDQEYLETGYAAIKGFDRLRQDLAEAGWRSLLVPGAPTVFRLPGRDGRSLELQLSCGGAVPEQTLAAGDAVAVCTVPTLAEDPAEWAEMANSLELLGDTWAASSGYLALSGGFVEDQIAAVRTALDRGTQRYALELAAYVSHPEGERQILELGGEVLGGHPVRFARGDLAKVLTDWDVEVAQSSRIADPQFDTLFDGVSGSLLAGPDGAVELAFKMSRVDHGQPITLTLSRTLPAGTHGGGTVNAQPADVVAVERPEVARLGVEGRFLPDQDGRIRIERHASAFLGSNGVLRLEIQLRRLD